jgi:hypothetical protein
MAGDVDTWHSCMNREWLKVGYRNICIINYHMLIFLARTPRVYLELPKIWGSPIWKKRASKLGEKQHLIQYITVDGLSTSGPTYQKASTDMLSSATWTRSLPLIPLSNPRGKGEASSTARSPSPQMSMSHTNHRKKKALSGTRVQHSSLVCSRWPASNTCLDPTVAAGTIR